MKLDRDLSLDGLRGVAALCVLVSHVGVPGFQGGGHGVDVFFVLSGFLITNILREQIASGGIDYRRFLLRRAARLFPALFLLLAVWLAVGPILWPQEHHLRDALISAFYVSNVAVALYDAPGQFLSHTWSLAVEEQFYLLWPLLLPLFARRQKPVVWLGLLYIALTVARLEAPWRIGYFCHPTGLILGALIAFMPPGKPWVALAGLPFLILGLTHGTWAPPFPGILLAEIGAALILSYRGASPINDVLSTKPLVWLGSISYGIYLWQQLFVMGLADWLWPERLAVSLAGSLIVAWLSYSIVEKPARRWVASRWAGNIRVTPG